MTELILNGYTDVPPGHIATMATFLEMREPPPARPVPDQPRLALIRIEDPDPEKYRAIFRRVGQDLLWTFRLQLDDAALLDILRDEKVELYLPQRGGEPVGILELDFRQPGEAEIAYFGLVPEAVGSGAGRWLMDHALRLAWRNDVGRVWLHTCTLDHPSGLPFYIRSGFVPYARKIETFPDPRLNGQLPRDAAPKVPIIEG